MIEVLVNGGEELGVGVEWMSAIVGKSKYNDAKRENIDFGGPLALAL
jgi:hypothetical protein